MGGPLLAAHPPRQASGRQPRKLIPFSGPAVGRQQALAGALIRGADLAPEAGFLGLSQHQEDAFSLRVVGRAGDRTLHLRDVIGAETHLIVVLLLGGSVTAGQGEKNAAPARAAVKLLRIMLLILRYSTVTNPPDGDRSGCNDDDY